MNWRRNHLKRLHWKDRFTNWLDFNRIEGWLRALKRLWYHICQRMDWNSMIESLCQYPFIHHWERSAASHTADIRSKRREIHWLPSFEIYNQMAWHLNLWVWNSYLNVVITIHHNQIVTLLLSIRDQCWSWRNVTLAWKLHWVWSWEYSYIRIFIVKHFHHSIWRSVNLQVCASSWRYFWYWNGGRSKVHICWRYREGRWGVDESYSDVV